MRGETENKKEFKYWSCLVGNGDELVSRKLKSGESHVKKKNVIVVRNSKKIAYNIAISFYYLKNPILSSLVSSIPLSIAPI